MIEKQIIYDLILLMVILSSALTNRCVTYHTIFIGKKNKP